MELTGDLKFVYQYPKEWGDIEINGTELLEDSGLENTVLISLFSDGRANSEDTLPLRDDDRRGWWGDVLLETPLPSKLWLLERSKITDETQTLAKQYCEEALEHMIEDGLADEIVVTVSRGGINQLNLELKIYKASRGTIFFRWFMNWNLQIFGGLN